MKVGRNPVIARIQAKKSAACHNGSFSVVSTGFTACRPHYPPEKGTARTSNTRDSREVLQWRIGLRKTTLRDSRAEEKASLSKAPPVFTAIRNTRITSNAIFSGSQAIHVFSAISDKEKGVRGLE